MSAQPRTTSALPAARRRFRAMGTDVEFVLEVPPTGDAVHALLDGEHELRRLEAIFTRFDPSSELRLLERHRVRRCSPELVEVVALALDARHRSRGRFDPTVLPALRAAGYDRTFRDVQRHPRASGAPIPAAGGVHLDRTAGTIALAVGGALDLGGIAMGWIADRVCERLARFAPALVDAGGDIACTARRDGAPWAVDIVGCDLRIDLREGGIATSGTDRRRWTDPASGRDQHHVIDPVTGAPATSDLVRVTTIAHTCAAAEAASTSLLVAGSSHVLDVAAAFDVAWRAERIDGSILASKDLR